MLPRILLTGFKPFTDVHINPTERLMNLVSKSAEQFPNALIKTLVLDTDYEICEQQLYHAIESFIPDVILSFGVSFATGEIKLERIAVNIDDSKSLDNGGNQRAGQKIVDDGPVGYWATIPVEEMYKALKDAGIPVRISNHAGTYVCNHLFYYGSHLIERLNLKALMGLIHVPPLPEQLKGEISKKGMDLETLVKATHICVMVVASHVSPLDLR